jgi:hypothetical protein
VPSLTWGVLAPSAGWNRARRRRPKSIGRQVMSVFLVLALAWLALAVLGWSLLAAAARADRARRPPRPRR